MKKESISRSVKIIIFVICLVLIIMGQKNIGPRGLTAMLAGLAGLLLLLHNYNKKFV